MEYLRQSFEVYIYIWQLIFKRHTKHFKMTLGIVFPPLNNKGVISGNGVVSECNRFQFDKGCWGHLC